MSIDGKEKKNIWTNQSDIKNLPVKQIFVEFLRLKMDLRIDNSVKIAKVNCLKPQVMLPGLCCDSGTMIAQDGLPQEVWLKIFSYLKIFDLGKCSQVCKWMNGICQDRSLKYNAIREIYQTTSTRFIKTLFYFKL